MSEIPDIPYASAAPQESVDAGHLKALAICHYVWGGLTLVLSCFFIIYIVIGVMMANGSMNGMMAASASSGPSAPPPPPPAVGYFLAAMGTVAIVIGWTSGILTIFSGRSISRRRSRIFSLVMAGVNCAAFPLGTLLGVFTFIVLLRASVRRLYPG